jgi:hypothetical protein
VRFEKGPINASGIRGPLMVSADDWNEFEGLVTFSASFKFFTIGHIGEVPAAPYERNGLGESRPVPLHDNGKEGGNSYSACDKQLRQSILSRCKNTIGTVDQNF